MRTAQRATVSTERSARQFASFEAWRRYSLAPPLYSLTVLLPLYEDDSLISWLACLAAFFASVLLSEFGLRA